MTKKSLPILLALMCFVLAACEDEDYRSDVPRFSDIISSEEVIKVNQPVAFTAKQSRKGRLLDATYYTWTVVPDDNVAITSVYKPKKGVYDGENPSATIVFSKAGDYKLTFIGDYRGSGVVEYFDISETPSVGVTAEYSANVHSDTSPANLYYLHAKVSKVIRVVE